MSEGRQQAVLGKNPALSSHIPHTAKCSEDGYATHTFMLDYAHMLRTYSCFIFQKSHIMRLNKDFRLRLAKKGSDTHHGGCHYYNAFCDLLRRIICHAVVERVASFITLLLQLQECSSFICFVGWLIPYAALAAVGGCSNIIIEFRMSS